MEKHIKVANLYVATLKAISLIHQFSHWTTKGDNFYGSHLLFERLYNATLANLDLAAEKFIGTFSSDSVDYDLQNELLSKVLHKYSNLDGSPIEMSIAAEKDFITLSKDAYDCFEKEGKLTLGIDDMLMEISSKHEEAIYLLQQTLK